MKYLIAVVLLSSTLTAQDAKAHKFWDRSEKITFSATLAVRAADAAQTCYNLAANNYTYRVNFSNGSWVMVPHHTWSEQWLPAKSCAGAAAMIGSGQLTQTIAQYALHRRGHHKLERWLPYFWTAPNAAGIAFTFH